MLDLVSKQAARFGYGDVSLKPSSDAPADVQVYDFGQDRRVSVALMRRRHPAASHLRRGLLSPDRDTTTAAPAHLIVTLQGVEGSALRRDWELARVMAAFTASSEAIAAKLGHGIMFYRADLFSELVEASGSDEFPLEVCVDLTLAEESEQRISLLTHGLSRYGREEFFVTSAKEAIEDAVDFTWGVSRWILDDADKQFHTGRVVGRNRFERIEIKRMPSPTDGTTQVIRLDM
jgi:hypothetical protein